MASITIRKLNPDTKTRLADLAARRGRSLEAEVRDILDCAAAGNGSPDDQEPFGTWLNRLARDAHADEGAPELADILDQLGRERHTDRPLADNMFD